jgi:hypothetical protein
LAEKHYKNVVVYCTAGVARNNVGSWPICAVEFLGTERNLAFYTAKDDAMLRDANFGLFAWDGKSKGTLRNVRLMAERGKPSAIYVSSKKDFVTVRTPQDFERLEHQVATETNEGLFSDSWRAA